MVHSFGVKGIGNRSDHVNCERQNQSSPSDRASIQEKNSDKVRPLHVGLKKLPCGKVRSSPEQCSQPGSKLKSSGQHKFETT